MTERIHRLLDAITDDGRHPSNVALLLVAAIVIGMKLAGWMD